MRVKRKSLKSRLEPNKKIAKHADGLRGGVTPTREEPLKEAEGDNVMGILKDMSSALNCLVAGVEKEMKSLRSSLQSISPAPSSSSDATPSRRTEVPVYIRVGCLIV